MNEYRWYIDCKDSKLLMNKLNTFFMEHQALSKELLVAKPLGICRIITSEKRKSRFKSLDSIWKNGKKDMSTCIIPSKNDSRGMS